MKPFSQRMVSLHSYTTDPARQPPEDYELWSRIARRFRVANLPERLTIYREVPKSISRAGDNPFLQKLVLISSENLALATGADKPEQVHIDIAALTHRSEAFISPNPNLKAMCAVVREAARTIGEGGLSEDLLDRVASAEARLRYLLELRRPAYKQVVRVGRAVRKSFRWLLSGVVGAS